MGRIPTSSTFTLKFSKNYSELIDAADIQPDLQPVSKTIMQPQIENKWTLPPSTETSLRCWFCHRDIKSEMIGVPLRRNFKFTFNEAEIDIYKKNLSSVNKIYETEGQFDNWCCAKSYIIKKIKEKRFEYNSSLALLNNMFYYYTGQHLQIPEAPDYTLQTNYGGSYSPEAYDALFGKDFMVVQTFNFETVLLVPKTRIIKKIPV